jgi:DNA-directed RNA polymerase subunit alpha
MVNNKKYQPLIAPSISWEQGLAMNTAVCHAEPLEPGFGVTFGNTLRRIMLGGIEGSAVTSVIIKGVNNEFSVIPGIVEDTLSILLNIKQLVIKNATGEEGVIRIKTNKLGPVFAKDLECDEHLSIVNEDHIVATISQNGEFDIQMFVKLGRGYHKAEWPLGKPLQEDDCIYIDATFAPVRTVTLDVQKTRVGKDIDYDKVILSITTDGSMTPKESFEYAIAVALNQFENFINAREIQIPSYTKEVEQKISNYAGSNLSKAFENNNNSRSGFKNHPNYELFLKPIDSLGLPARVHNCLIGSSVQRVIDLVNMSEHDVTNIKNFGKKSYEDLVQIMKEFELAFSMNIDEKELINFMEQKK